MAEGRPSRAHRRPSRFDDDADPAQITQALARPVAPPSHSSPGKDTHGSNASSPLSSLGSSSPPAMVSTSTATTSAPSRRASDVAPAATKRRKSDASSTGAAPPAQQPPLKKQKTTTKVKSAVLDAPPPPPPVREAAVDAGAPPAPTPAPAPAPAAEPVTLQRGGSAQGRETESGKPVKSREVVVPVPPGPVEVTPKVRTPAPASTSAKEPTAASTPPRKRPKVAEAPVKVSAPATATARPKSKAPVQPAPKKRVVVGGLDLLLPQAPLKKDTTQAKAPAAESRVTDAPAAAPPPAPAPVFMSHEERIRDLDRRRVEERQALDLASKDAFDLLEQADLAVAFEGELRPMARDISANAARMEAPDVVPLPRLMTFGSLYSLFPRSEPASEPAPPA